MYGNYNNVESLREVQAQERARLARELEQRRLLREAGVIGNRESLMVRISRFLQRNKAQPTHIRPALDLR